MLSHNLKDNCYDCRNHRYDGSEHEYHCHRYEISLKPVLISSTRWTATIDITILVLYLCHCFPIWWRWGDSNPRPNDSNSSLYTAMCQGVLQESLWWSLLLPGRSTSPAQLPSGSKSECELRVGIYMVEAF
jgi:hypothetical protein